MKFMKNNIMEKYMTKSIFIALVFLTIASFITACSTLTKPNTQKTSVVKVGIVDEPTKIEVVEVPALKQVVTLRCEIVE